MPFAGNGGFTLLGNRFAVGGTLAAPTSDGRKQVGRWAAGNALTTAAEIPEPATLALLALAACGLGGYVRKRRTV